MILVLLLRFELESSICSRPSPVLVLPPKLVSFGSLFVVLGFP